MIEAARDRVPDLLGQTLAEDCTDPTTGKLTALIVVTDNGACFKAAEFARNLRSRPEFTHVRTRVKAPGTNGQIERFFGSIKCEHLLPPRDRRWPPPSPVTSTVYSTIRPHEAPAFATPIDVYQAEPDVPVQTR